MENKEGNLNKRKEERVGKHRRPYTLRPKKKYRFPSPVPPCSVVRVKNAPKNPWRAEVGRRFRVGYYSQQDGLDCILLVNDQGKYEQSLDHETLARFFDIETVSQERSRYGRNRPQFSPIS
jgi:hypothetical protein